MFKLLVIAALATVALAGLMPRQYNLLKRFAPNGRLAGGRPVTIEDVPHQVSLQYYGIGFCGATIIGENWLLTAAQCATFTPEETTARAGTHHVSDGGNIYEIEKFIQHENYSTNVFGVSINDVAVVKLKTPIHFDSTKQPIELFKVNEEAEPGRVAVITGWGSFHEGGSTSEILQKISIPIISKKICNNAYSDYGGLPGGQICAAHPEGGKNPCYGDTGGPLTIDGRLAGIVSWGLGCAEPIYPDVYIEVASYHDWIVKQTRL